MSTSASELQAARAVKVSVTNDVLRVELADGRMLAVPTAWYPRLAHGNARERSHWRLIGQGTGVHWPDLDEDISIESLLAGRRSGETRQSLKRWLGSRSSKAAPRKSSRAR
ncbi:MAG TPA: DUF2442 domain-containing protein [Candidatus Binatia bacterium]|nr:DUF2442 domain-containing protein [Candidatus Binatia bacterium]